MRKRQFHNFDLRKEQAMKEVKEDTFNLINAVYKANNISAEQKNTTIGYLIIAGIQTVDKIKAI